MRTALILVLAMTVSVTAQNAPEKPKADVIFTHGNVYTGIVDPTSMVAGKRAGRTLAIGEPPQSVVIGAPQQFSAAVQVCLRFAEHQGSVGLVGGRRDGSDGL